MRGLAWMAMSAAAFAGASAAGAQKGRIETDSRFDAEMDACDALARNPEAPTRAEYRRIVTCYLPIHAARLNQNRPRRLSDHVTELPMTVSGTELTQHFIVAPEPGRSAAEQGAQLAAEIEQHMCSRGALLEMIEEGASFRFVWRDPGGRRIAELRCPPAEQRPE